MRPPSRRTETARNLGKSTVWARRCALLTSRPKLAAVTVLDPACGSGNFLYVALLARCSTWRKRSQSGRRRSGDADQPCRLVSPAQLHGIEINPYAHELAQTTIWIGYIQWLRDNGFGLPPEPILKPLTTFRRMDAIMAGDRDQESGAGAGKGSGNPSGRRWT